MATSCARQFFDCRPGQAPPSSRPCHATTRRFSPQSCCASKWTLWTKQLRSPTRTRMATDRPSSRPRALRPANTLGRWTSARSASTSLSPFRCQCSLGPAAGAPSAAPRISMGNRGWISSPKPRALPPHGRRASLRPARRRVLRCRR